MKLLPFISLLKAKESKLETQRTFVTEFAEAELNSLQCRRILGGRNLVRVRNIVVTAIFDFMTVEDWGE